MSRYKLALLGAVAGTIAGYFYYKASSCTAGACIITSHPANTMLYGALVGSLLFSIFEKERKPKP